MLTFNLKTTFFTVKTSNEVYCCRIYFVNYIQNVHIINRTLHGSLEDMDFMFSWQEQYLTRSLRSLVRYCSCHSNIKSISSRNRVISYIYYMDKDILLATKTLHPGPEWRIFCMSRSRVVYRKIPAFFVVFFFKMADELKVCGVKRRRHLSLLRTIRKC